MVRVKAYGLAVVPVPLDVVPVAFSSNEWTVAKVCDVYLADLHDSANPEWATQVENCLNDLCGYCGALKVSEFKKKHLRTWLQKHTT